MKTQEVAMEKDIKINIDVSMEAFIETEIDGKPETGEQIEIYNEMPGEKGISINVYLDDNLDYGVICYMDLDELKKAIERTEGVK